MHIHSLCAYFHIQQNLIELLFCKVCSFLPGIVEQQAGDRLAEHGDLRRFDLCPWEIIDLKFRCLVLNTAALRKQDSGYRHEHSPDDQQLLPAECPQPGKDFLYHCCFPCQNRTTSRPFALR